MSGLNKARRDFIAHILIMMLALPGRRTALNLARRAAYSEKSIWLHFRQDFDWQEFNSQIATSSDHEFIIAFDPTYLPKSGTKTHGKGRFWSGLAGKILPALEFCGISLIDTQARTALHYRVFQTPNKEELNERGMDLLEHYGSLIRQEGVKLRKLSRYFVADAYFPKKNSFVKYYCKNWTLSGK